MFTAILFDVDGEPTGHGETPQEALAACCRNAEIDGSGLTVEPNGDGVSFGVVEGEFGFTLGEVVPGEID